MQLQLVTIRVKKIEGLPFAFIVFPDRHSRLFQLIRERLKIFWRNAECVVGIVTFLRGHVVTGYVVRKVPVRTIHLTNQSILLVLRMNELMRLGQTIQIFI
ncbi:hypothetical protein AEW27_16545 [Salmonella enterica subsp. enterica serovar Montevideo]|nr:hypothetical protein Y007_20780 [Salmonella enterica subsp. enterica serovar Montevideo str. 507440-20]KDQ95557.1 hypothetical protein SEEMF064_11700 [Salmonella enterica subsp. enterica serovar Montevideo str. FVM_628064]KNM02658.1 hypothetical protein AEU81_01780 [Salmonella enterica subsp. enterica serovar Montevideo]KNS47947.1 hypothetical protein AEW21_03670 [Salmonella enterica subsp. enterica serovar Montevideo]KNS60336.1 hypothetical protein AEW27_16545 [Salmonella enterica subsp. en